MDEPKSTLGGAPSKYDPAYCQVAIDYMSLGFSQTALAGHLGICKKTLYNWMDDHPEFLHAISRAKPKRVNKLEQDLLSSDNAAVINARKFALINADRDEWQERRFTENTHDAKIVYLSDQDKAL